MLLHLLDAAPPDGSDPVSNYQTIRAELANFSPVLAEKPEVVALNKIELIPEGERSSFIERIAGALGFAKDEHPLAVSGATGEGVREMLEVCWNSLLDSRESRTDASRSSSGWGTRE